jgi:hypothetical protein
VVFTVNSVLTEGDVTLRDIKGQAELPVPAPASTAPLAAVGIVLILAVLAGGIYVYRKRRTPVVMDTRPPYQVAFDELQRIQTLNLPAENELGAYCDLVSNCVRHYVETGLNIPATDRTTSEIKGLVRQSHLTTEQGQQLIRLLTQCDLVKFSGWSPVDSDAAQELLIQAGYFVESTRPQAQDTLVEDQSSKAGGQAA